MPVCSVGHVKGGARRLLKVTPFVHHSHLTHRSEVKPTSRTRSYIWCFNHGKMKENESRHQQFDLCPTCLRGRIWKKSCCHKVYVQFFLRACVCVKIGVLLGQVVTASFCSKSIKSVTFLSGAHFPLLCSIPSASGGGAKASKWSLVSEVNWERAHWDAQSVPIK